ncbi:membrane protein [Pseudonocardia sp. Ae168_Ps1]|uniref:DUF389 domain-containing protein n=1 Tax=unclassified Pseudonocardia TaxID=2619320 RepID=UPI0001FFF23E|nr:MULTISPECIES: DUF389 domain-containing protein [unclassified Pseudonocardia]ALE73202.1 membrane protein [Pseudonocardia sp. EC080625-04]ALL76535.1 membrane protein [Pseudonocardia sp. EC080610-09]ALL83561.1 membrane protein [Pseudonocardia sp. EC080619-01]OLL72582.1 membrane protein [Pseudonocardia sp. Ae150A_Ps1]OLL78554.1 membrane protein [Pseudonocardia sp. Ae168_Ps1]
MLHLRVVCPSGRTTEVCEVLTAEPGVAHLVVHPGAAVRPPGDLVEADVARECTDDLLGRLADLGVDHDGGITLEQLDTVLSDRADAAEEAAPGDGADAVVWDELIHRTGEESRLSLTFLTFLTIACLLAAVGAVTDSPVTVVGAMVLGPEFGPMAAMAVGLVLRRADLIRRGAAALLVGFPFAMAVTALATVLFDLFGWLSSASLDGLEQMDFIYEVGPFSLVVAVLAGAAGMLSLTSARSSALVGVFISVTTVPAAAYGSVAAIEGRWVEAALSVLQLGLNLAGAIGSAAVVLLLARHRSRRRGADRTLSEG